MFQAALSILARTISTLFLAIGGPVFNLEPYNVPENLRPVDHQTLRSCMVPHRKFGFTQCSLVAPGWAHVDIYIYIYPIYT